MLFFSFGNRAFNKEFSESNIYVVVSPKYEYEDELSFLDKAINFIDDKVYPGEDFKSEYEGIYLKDGEYKEIIDRWIQSMNQSIEIKMDEIIEVQRIKCSSSNPYRDEYLIETAEEYMMFLWSTTA